MTESRRMDLVESLKVIADRRSDEIVLTSMGNAREWMKLSEHPLDFVHVPSSMGQTFSLALGLALAQPQRRVVACSGDGSLLMNLGCLVTISAQSPTNLKLIACDNAAYEVTGAQWTAGVSSARRHGDPIDLAAVARASGISAVHAFDCVEKWNAEWPRILEEPGLSFVHLRVATIPGAVGPRSPGKAPPRAQAFRRALGVGP